MEFRFIPSLCLMQTNWVLYGRVKNMQVYLSAEKNKKFYAGQWGGGDGVAIIPGSGTNQSMWKCPKLLPNSTLMPDCAYIINSKLQPFAAK